MYNSRIFKSFIILSLLILIITNIFANIVHNDEVAYIISGNSKKVDLELLSSGLIYTSYENFKIDGINMNIINDYYETDYFRRVFNEYKNYYIIKNSFITQIGFSLGYANIDKNWDEENILEINDVIFRYVNNDDKFINYDIEFYTSLYTHLPDFYHIKPIKLKTKKVFAKSPDILIDCMDDYKEKLTNENAEILNTGEIIEFIEKNTDNNKIDKTVDKYIKSDSYVERGTTPSKTYWVYKDNKFDRFDSGKDNVKNNTYIILITTSDFFKGYNRHYNVIFAEI